MKKAFVAAGAAVLVAALAACGDPITASHDWQARTVVNGLLISNPGAYGQFNPVVQVSLRGKLSDTSGRPVAATSFVEECISPPVSEPGGAIISGIKDGPVPCTVIVNTGRQIYVARGVSTKGFAGAFASLDSTGRGTLTVTVLDAYQTQGARLPNNYLVRISAR